MHSRKIIVNNTDADFVARQAEEARSYFVYDKLFLCRFAAKDGLWNGKDFLRMQKTKNADGNPSAYSQSSLRKVEY